MEEERARAASPPSPSALLGEEECPLTPESSLGSPPPSPGLSPESWSTLFEETPETSEFVRRRAAVAQSSTPLLPTTSHHPVLQEELSISQAASPPIPPQPYWWARATTAPPAAASTLPVWSPVPPLEVLLPYHNFSSPSNVTTPNPFWTATPNRPAFREYILYISSVPHKRTYFYAHKKNISQEEVDNEDHCVICLTAFQLDDEVVGPSCNHFFHYHCMHNWLLVTKSCPLCRSIIDWDAFHLKSD